MVKSQEDNVVRFLNLSSQNGAALGLKNQFNFKVHVSFYLQNKATS